MSMTEKVSYIMGLCDGLELDTTTKEGKILTAIVDLLADISQEVVEAKEDISELTEYTEAVDEAVESLEAEVFPEDDDEDYDDFDEDDMVICPSCGEELYLEPEDFDSDSIVCPECGAEFDLEDCFDDECDCECDDEECSCSK